MPQARANAADASLPTFEEGKEFFKIRRTQASGGSNSTAAEGADKEDLPDSTGWGELMVKPSLTVKKCSLLLLTVLTWLHDFAALLAKMANVRARCLAYKKFAKAHKQPNHEANGSRITAYYFLCTVL
jgi:hypothetical protein